MDPLTTLITTLQTLPTPQSLPISTRASYWRTKQRLLAELDYRITHDDLDEHRIKLLTRIANQFKEVPVLEKWKSMPESDGKPEDGSLAGGFVKELGETKALNAVTLNGRTTVHPVTSCALLTPVTGPAAPASVRVERARVREGILRMKGVPRGGVGGVRELGRVKREEGVKREVEDEGLGDEGLGDVVPVLSDTQSDTRHPGDTQHPHRDPGATVTIDLDGYPMAIMAALKGVTAFEPTIAQRPLTTLAGTTTHTTRNPVPAPYTQALPKPHVRSTIIDRTVETDALFSHLMGQKAALAVRPTTTTVPPTGLPQLTKQIRTGVTAELDETGQVRPSTVSFIALTEVETGPANLRPLTINFIAKCKPSDPCPLMPSHVPPLHLKGNNEPIRDRDKVWKIDSERVILGTDIETSIGRVLEEKMRARRAVMEGVAYDYTPPLVPGSYRPGGHASRSLVYAAEAGYLISRELLWRGACLVSRSYCVLTAFGMGVAGRVHAPGLHIPRFILLQAYTEANSKEHQIWITMEMLESLLEDRQEFLKAGMKMKMIFEICKMCYFEYEIFEQYQNEENAPSHQRSDVLPPKVTKYRHNETWHTDRSDEEMKAEEEEGEDEALAVAEVERKERKKKVLTPTNKLQATPTFETAAEDEQEEKKTDEPTSPPPPPQDDDSTPESAAKSPINFNKSRSRVRTMSNDRSCDVSPEKIQESDPNAPAKVVLNDHGEVGQPGERTSVWQKKVTWVVEHLRVSKGRKKSAADLRRDELRAKRAAEAEVAAAARRKWLATPKRKRGLVLGRGCQISGFLVTAMVYEFKAQPGMLKVRLFNTKGGMYELKISASSVGKESGVKKKPIKWSPEQKRDIVLSFLRGKTDMKQLPPRCGLPELEEVPHDTKNEMQTRFAWHKTGRVGMLGPHMKRKGVLPLVVQKNFTQVKCNVAGGAAMIDPMLWERAKGGDVVRLRDLRHPNKKKKDKNEDEEEKRASSSKRKSRRSVEKKEAKDGKRGGKGEKERSKSSRSSSRGKETEKKSSRSTSRGGKREKVMEEVVEDVAQAAAEEEELEEEKKEEEAVKVVEKTEMRSFAKSTADFYDARRRLLDVPEFDYYGGKMGIHHEAYCPYNFFQPPTSQLGAPKYNKVERRGRKVFRIGCKPLREVGKGKRMASGAGKVGDLRGVFELYRSGKNNSWNCNDGSGEDLKLFFTVCSEIPDKYKGKLEQNGVFMFDLKPDDLYRCCVEKQDAKDADAAKVANSMDVALMGDKSALKDVEKGQAERKKEMDVLEKQAFENCVNEKEKANKLSAKVRMGVKEKADEEFRKIKEEIKEERLKMRGLVGEVIVNAEKAWGDSVRKMLKLMSWFEVSFGVDDFMNIDGDMQNSSVQLPCVLAERKAVGVGAAGRGKKAGEDAQSAYFTIRFETTVYRCVHKIQSRSQYRDQFRTLLFTVSQERYKLRFIGYDFETSDVFTFSYEEGEQEETIRSLRELSSLEISIQFQLAFLNVEYVDDGLAKGSQKRKFKVQFAGEIEGGTVEVQMTDAERKRAAKNLDEMMNATGSRARSRQQAGAKKLEDEGELGFGVVEDED